MKKLNGNNVHLHNHTSRGSLLDSTLTIKQMISFAKENGQSAIAITNHGKMHDYINFYKACKKENIKPIIGCEIYEVEDLNNEETKSNRYHLVLLVKNQKGLQNLFKIISDAHTKFFYYRPIIDLKYIKENNLGEGLICLTACQAGRFSKMAIDKLDINNYYNNLNNIFDNTYIELQSHSTESQIIANKHIFNVIQKYQLPYVITCDSHMLSEEDQEVHGIFVEINQDRDVGESYKDCYLQNNIEIHNIMDTQIGKENVNIALNNNFNISGMIEEINIGLDNTYQMPDISKHMPKQFKNIEEWYDFLIEEGFKKRGHHLKSKEFQQARRDRLLLEKPVLKELRYLDYFIMCYMLLEECRKRQIPIGLSRGSSAGCQSLYYLNITQLDSIKWDLYFSRFANLGRQQMADIDKSKSHLILSN